MNPPYELEYWLFGLETAILWKKRLGLSVDEKWIDIIKNIARPPIKDGVYLTHENCPQTYTEKYNYDHPSMVGALGMLKGDLVDKEVMKNTLTKVLEEWQMEKVWGWDFPMLSMTATRLNMPEIAIDCLLHSSKKNEYLINGHNKQADRESLSIYLPGNGGFLIAIGLMCAGYDGSEQYIGFPKDGNWEVVYEDINKII